MLVVSALADAISAGTVSERVWFYSNYHCNLQCSYYLTESAPAVRRRELGEEAILARSREAAELGFEAFGVTGGEPFILDYMPALVAELGRRLPTVVLSNATLFNERRLREVEPLADLPVHIQISLDHPDPVENDEMRGPEMRELPQGDGGDPEAQGARDRGAHRDDARGSRRRRSR